MLYPKGSPKVLIFGLGLNGGGVGMAKYFTRRGFSVTVTDLKTKTELKESLNKLKKYPIKYILGKHREKDFIENDIIVVNPAVPPNNKYLKLAKKHNKKIIIELLYVIDNFPGKIIGITGTKGKTTTTMLIYSILKEHFKNTDTNVYVGGNIRTSTVDILKTAKPKDIAILEIPSYQLEHINLIKKSPNISVITNLGEDHINWHKTIENYHRAKKNIFKYQKEKDILVVRKEMLRKISKYKIPSKVLIAKKVNKNTAKNFKLKGTHNQRNLSLAVTTTKAMKVEEKTINKAIQEFNGVPFRQEVVTEINKVKFINDTTSTNLRALKAAINTFKESYNKRIILILGGVDKNLDYRKVKKSIEKYTKAIILLEGSASEKIYKVLDKKKVTIFKFYKSLEKAVKKAYEVSSKGDVVVLSPAASSFNMFKNEFDRGEQFNEIVKKLYEKEALK